MNEHGTDSDGSPAPAASRAELRLGALGGDTTFGGEAADLLCQAYPEFVEVRYFVTAEQMYSAVERGDIDAACAPEQTSTAGFHARSQAKIAFPGSPFHVLAEMQHAYRCSLLVRPGTSLAQVRTVLGHTGSISQSRPWLEAHLPAATIEVVATNSLGAAEIVASGDGTTASVGTRRAAARVGLSELAREIDDGSVGNYWAIGTRPLFPERATRWVVAARCGGDGDLGRMIASLQAAGLCLLTCHVQPTGSALFEYDHVLRLAGPAAVEAIRVVLRVFPTARLAGAFVAPSDPRA